MQRIDVEKMQFPQYDDIDVIKSWNWFMSFLTEKNWKSRKERIENSIAIKFQKTKPFSVSLNQGTLIVIKDDVIGWYLYLVEILINEPHKYEPFQSSRVIPIFKSLGIDLEVLKNIEGIDIRVKELLKKRKSEADALLFEMLTAVLWAKNGYQVSFIPEKNNEKTPDLIAKKNGDIFNIECKRQSKTSDYAYKESEKRQKMVSYISKALIKRNILLDIVFHVELKTLPDTFLRDLLHKKIEVANSGIIISNEKVEISLSFVDIPLIQEHLKHFVLKYNSPMLNKLIGKKSVDNKSFTCGLSANFYRVGEGEVNNLYISDIDKAYGVYWYCDAEQALWTKARDIKGLLRKAIKQFKSENRGVIHIGMETFDGPQVEKSRFNKIKNTIESIDPTKTSLSWIFCHFFQSYSPHDQDWVFDETVSTISPYSNQNPPLNNRLLIIPDNEETEDGISHWDKPLP